MTSRPLDPIFSPGSIAVIGASRRRESLGFRLLHNLIVNEFTGAIYPVNPGARAIHSLKAYPALLAGDMEKATLLIHTTKPPRPKPPRPVED